MAKGSQKQWGGWETKTCWICGERLTLQRHTASHHYNGGRPFSLCGEHGSLYAIARLGSHPALEVSLDAPERVAIPFETSGVRDGCGSLLRR